MSVLTERSDDKSYLSDSDSDDDISRVEKARSKSPVLNYSSDNYSDELSDKDSLAPSSVVRTTRKSTRTSARNSLQNSAGNSRYSSQLSRNSTRNNSERASQMNSAPVSAENSKRQISIAESNLTSRDSSTSLSDASSIASHDDSLSPERAPTHTIHKSSHTHEVPMVAQGTATTSNSLRRSKLNSARSTNHRPDSQARDANLERRKMTTPYGHVLSKNGYIMVSKLKSSRSGYTHRGYPNQKVDPITARILSANQKRRAIAGNQAGEIKKKNMQLYEEIKSLRILCRNQEKSLKQYESTQSALPRVLQNFEHDKALLKERLRKVKENEKRLEREKKRLDIENEKNQKKLKELNNIIQTKNLDERWNLQQRLELAERVAAENADAVNHVNRKFELEQAALERQLKKEIRRRTKAEQENDRNKEELQNIQEKLTEKEKQLNYSNIYIQRQNKKSKQKRSSSLALPAPPQEESEVDLNATGDNVVPNCNPIVEFAIERVVSREQSRPQSKAVSRVQEVVPRRAASSTFLTDIVETNESDPPVANLNDFNFQEELSTGAPFMADASPAPIKEEPILDQEKISTPRDPTPEPAPIKMQEAPPSPPKPEQSADALLDEMLFGSKVEEKKATPPQSPTLFDMNDKPKLSSQDSVPEFDFGPTKKTSKDSILAQLRDLHGNDDSPSNQKPKMNFNIFDSAPKIDPKEAPKSKEDELDELLNFGSKNQSSSMSIKRSDPKVYDFSEPINNLHEGKASSGKDFRSPTKKENLIDNLFGGTGMKQSSLI